MIAPVTLDPRTTVKEEAGPVQSVGYKPTTLAIPRTPFTTPSRRFHNIPGVSTNPVVAGGISKTDVCKNVDLCKDKANTECVLLKGQEMCVCKNGFSNSKNDRKGPCEGG